MVDDDDMAIGARRVGEEELDDCDICCSIHHRWGTTASAVSVAIEPDEAGRDPNAATAGRMKYEERSPLAPELGEAGREGRTSPRWKSLWTARCPWRQCPPDYEF